MFNVLPNTYSCNPLIRRIETFPENDEASETQNIEEFRLQSIRSSIFPFHFFKPLFRTPNHDLLSTSGGDKPYLLVILKRGQIYVVEERDLTLFPIARISAAVFVVFHQGLFIGIHDKNPEEQNKSFSLEFLEEQVIIPLFEQLNINSGTIFCSNNLIYRRIKFTVTSCSCCANRVDYDRKCAL